MKSTTTNSGAGRLQEQVSVTPSGVFASTPSVCGHRAGIRDPKFSSVIYALRKFNKAYVKKEDIFINVKPQVGGHGTAVDTNKPLIARRNKMRNLRRSPFSSAVGSRLLWSVEEAPGPSTGGTSNCVWPHGHHECCTHPKEKTGNRSHQKFKTKQVCLLLFWGGPVLCGPRWLRHHITSVGTRRTPGRDPREKNTAAVSENYNAAKRTPTHNHRLFPLVMVTVYFSNHQTCFPSNPKKQWQHPLCYLFILVNIFWPLLLKKKKRYIP